MTGFTQATESHIWSHPDGRFTFTDETGAAWAEYRSIEAAMAGANAYRWYVLEGIGERLKHEELLVTFKKADGTLRTMRCTAKPGAFPVRESVTHPKPANIDAQVVMDLDKAAVRSFRKDSIVSISQPLY